MLAFLILFASGDFVDNYLVGGVVNEARDNVDCVGVAYRANYKTISLHIESQDTVEYVMITD